MTFLDMSYFMANGPLQPGKSFLRAKFITCFKQFIGKKKQWPLAGCNDEGIRPICTEYEHLRGWHFRNRGNARDHGLNIFSNRWVSNVNQLNIGVMDDPVFGVAEVHSQT